MKAGIAKFNKAELSESPGTASLHRFFQEGKLQELIVQESSFQRSSPP
jgi:hypothetical protein